MAPTRSSPRNRATCLAALALVVLAVSSASVAQTPLLRAPDGATAARRSRYDRRQLVDCAEHGVWTAPEGWSTHALDRAAMALAPDGSAAILRAPARPRLRDDAGFAASVTAIIERLTGARPTLDAVEGVDRNRWRRERTVRGTVTVQGTHLVVRGHAERTEAVWVALHRDADATASAAIDRAVGSWLPLVSHACECGYDCDHR